MLDNAPIPLSLEKDNDPRLVTSPLKFPGKLAIDVLNNRLFISDSNHNRIVGSLCALFIITFFPAVGGCWGWVGVVCGGGKKVWENDILMFR